MPKNVSTSILGQVSACIPTHCAHADQNSMYRHGGGADLVPKQRTAIRSIVV